MIDRSDDPQLTAALEEALRRLAAGDTLEQCLTEAPAAYRTELAELLPLARRVRGVARHPSVAFEQRLEANLLAAVEARRRLPPTRLVARLWRALQSPSLVRAALALVAVLVLSGAVALGAVAASEDALPDSPLYSVKLARERAELALAPGRVAQLRISVRLAQQRARELERAVQIDASADLIGGLARRTAIATERVVEESLALQQDGTERPSRRVRQGMLAEQARVAALIPQAAPDVQPILMQLRDVLSHQLERLRERAMVPNHSG